ncbi:MAG: family 78 glycoside hydrolase catalytic domain [Actinomycetota bacterium]
MIPVHPKPFTSAWTARWIWHGQPAITMESATRPVLDHPADRVMLMRRTLDLDAVPSTAPCRVWADGRYVLAVNGVEVARGPVRSDPRRAHYDLVDLAPFLRIGRNVLAITARHFGRATSWWMPAPPSYTLGGGGVVLEAVIGDLVLVSDRQWRTQPGEAWTPIAVPGDVASLPLESFDARVHPASWQDPDFDDTAWARAFEITPFHTGAHGFLSPPSEPFGALLPPVRDTFPDGERHVASADTVRHVVGAALECDPVRQVLADQRTTDPGAVALRGFDLGRIAAGTVQMTVTGATAGTVIDVAAAEYRRESGALVPLGQHSGYRYICHGGGTEEFETFDLVGTRFFQVAVRSPDGSEPTIAIAVRDRHRPRPAGASFECSDPLLNRIHEIGLRTVDLCALDAYVDCPTREQRAWTGDSVVHQMVDLVANPDWSMAIWHPQLTTMSRSDGMVHMAVASDFAQDDRMFIPDWALHWVHSVHNLFRYTGDRQLVADLSPSVERVLRWFESYRRPDGLLDNVTGWVLLDWSSVYSSGCSSTLNALWARGLEEFAEMSEWLGNPGTASWARQRYAEVRAAFDLFWDERRGVYVDHVVNGVVQPQAAQHPGATALAAGLVPASRIDRVLERLLDRSRLVRHSWVMDSVTVDGGSVGFVHLTAGYPPPTWDVEREMVEAQPFFRYVVHDGVVRAGRPDLIVGLCRDWQVFVDAGETSWPECWTGGTRCHGWSSTPTRDLVVRTLGITPAEPGYARVRVEPHLGDLDWARATVPTPHGPVTVEAFADGRVYVDSPVPVVSHLPVTVKGSVMSEVSSAVAPPPPPTYPPGVKIASPWLRLAAYLLEAVLQTVTLGIGWLIWAAIVAGNGQTPAKQLLRMRVVGASEPRPVGFARMFFMRGIVAGVLAGLLIVVTLGIILFMPLWDRRNRNIWDKVSGTVVVPDPDNAWRL